MHGRAATPADAVEMPTTSRDTLDRSYLSRGYTGLMKQKARLLGHDLWVSQDLDGAWHCWISGSTPFDHEGTFETAEQAKKFVHSLAHDHLQHKHECDCPEPLVWVSKED